MYGNFILYISIVFNKISPLKVIIKLETFALLLTFGKFIEISETFKVSTKNVQNYQKKCPGS